MNKNDFHNSFKKWKSFILETYIAILDNNMDISSNNEGPIFLIFKP